MPYYRFSGYEFFLPYDLQDLNDFKVEGKARLEAEAFHPSSEFVLLSQDFGFIAGSKRQVELWSTPSDIFLRVSGGSDFYITSNGEVITRVSEAKSHVSQGNVQPSFVLSGLDREILLGPALVMALALRGAWCLHASAVLFAGNVFLFLGESGQGKSTLAAYLSSDPTWRLVADDILPVRINADGVSVLPHFPQLKLPMNAQPGPELPESLPLNKIYTLTPAEPDAMPELQQLPPSLAVQELLRHTAGTRMFSPKMLGNHLSFCSLAARQIPVYQLTYPHRKEALPKVKELLEKSC